VDFGKIQFPDENLIFLLSLLLAGFSFHILHLTKKISRDYLLRKFSVSLLVVVTVIAAYFVVLFMFPESKMFI
jgi:hypothetical protein